MSCDISPLEVVTAVLLLLPSQSSIPVNKNNYYGREGGYLWVLPLPRLCPKCPSRAPCRGDAIGKGLLVYLSVTLLPYCSFQCNDPTLELQSSLCEPRTGCQSSWLLL